MNIFVLDDWPDYAARYHCDKHVCKMIVEYAQILSTAHSVSGSWHPPMYKPTHVNHPCSVWARKHARNYRWLYALLCALLHEYKARYARTHKTSGLTLALWRLPTNLRLSSHEQSWHCYSWVLAMPQKYQNPYDAVLSYRRYYMGEKAHIATWLNGKPYWFKGRG